MTEDGGLSLVASDPAVQAEGLEYSYSPEMTPGLRGIQLDIPRGQLVAILGANGSGKSTLAKILAGLLIPLAGSLRILGNEWVDPSSAAGLRRRVGIVFQSPDQQMVATTVVREIAFGPENLGLPAAEIRSRVEAMMKQFRLEPLVHRLPHQLSGGEKQRLALASVLVMQPEILILDEVTSLLDPCDRREILGHIRRMKRRCTIIMITQFAEEALISDRVLMMQAGSIVLDGTPQELFAKAASTELCGVEVPLIYRLLRIIQSPPSA